VDYTTNIICTGALALNSHTINLGNIASGAYSGVITTSLDNGQPTDTETSSITITTCCDALASFNVNNTLLFSVDQDSSIFTNTNTNAQSQEWFVNNTLVSTSLEYRTVFTNPGIYDVKLKVVTSY
jgi:hypothetical protein